MQSTTSYRASNVSSFPVILYRDRKYLAKTLFTDTRLHSPLNNILYEDKKAKNTSIKTEASEILSQKEDWNTINRKNRSLSLTKEDDEMKRKKEFLEIQENKA